MEFVGAENGGMVDDGEGTDAAEHSTAKFGQYELYHDEHEHDDATVRIGMMHWEIREVKFGLLAQVSMEVLERSRWESVRNPEMSGTPPSNALLLRSIVFTSCLVNGVNSGFGSVPFK